MRTGQKINRNKPEETVVQADFSFIDADGNALVQQSLKKLLNKELFADNSVRL